MAIPGLIALISYGGRHLFAVVIAVVCLRALWEYYRMVLPTAGGGGRQGLLLWGYAIAAAVIGAAYLDALEWMCGLMILNLMGCALISIKRFRTDALILDAVFKQVLGVGYVAILLACLVLIRNGSDGPAWIYWVLLVVFAGDTGAFYVGTYWGRHKLAPAVSPGKTIEGAVGGLAFNLAVGSLFKYLVMPAPSWGPSLLLFISMGAAGQVGDLFESQIKRSCNIKDSGSLLPGHGGLLDRIDALLFAAPVAYFFKEYIL